MDTITSPGFLLTPDEVAQITGRKSKKHQVQWLTTKHWQFEVNARGVPIIARSYAETRLSGVTPMPQATRTRRPNFEALPAA